MIEIPNRLARSVVGADTLPLWSPDLPEGGKTRKRPKPEGDADVVYLPACIGRMFGPARGHDPVQDSFEALCRRVGITVAVPEDVDSLCCGTPASSKGFPYAAGVMRSRTLESLRKATRNGAIPIVCDASSCTEALIAALDKDQDAPRLTVVDVVQYAAGQILPKLQDARRVDRLVLHPTCSSNRMGISEHLKLVAYAAAKEVVVPDDWGCCAFAGDRGMLHPELTASATGPEADSVARLEGDAFASCSRTCELGMSRATGRDYIHVLTVLEEATRPRPGRGPEPDGRERNVEQPTASARAKPL
jgi:D-lactate dehydrogenase